MRSFDSLRSLRMTKGGGGRASLRVTKGQRARLMFSFAALFKVTADKAGGFWLRLFIPSPRGSAATVRRFAAAL